MKSLRVLVVEDEALVAMLVEQAVEDNGDTVAATASDIQGAMHYAATLDFDVALLDLNLHGQKAHAVPAVIRARKKPFAFVTGYGDAGVLAAFTDAPIVAKPFRTADIAKALAVLRSQCQ